jgi:hypothetical protein
MDIINMGWRSKSKTRKKALKKGYRSGFESKVADQISEHKINPKKIYETTTIPYTVPAKNRTYLVDFSLPNGILVETKGRWVTEDRAKHLLIKKQHPKLDIRIVFMSARTKIRKGSKTTYGDWCDKNGIIWAEKEIPEAWFSE